MVQKILERKNSFFILFLVPCHPSFLNTKTNLKNESNIESVKT